jgi:hypothetical protein
MKGLRAHGGDCAARGSGARPPLGARGAGMRKTASFAPPLLSPRGSWLIGNCVGWLADQGWLPLPSWLGVS